MRTRGLLDSVVQGLATLGALVGVARLFGLEAKRIGDRDALPGHLPAGKGGYEMSFGLPEVTRVIGSFQDEEAALSAAKAVMAEWHGGFQVYSPNLNEEFFAVMRLPESPTRFWILGGGIFGQLSGWALTIMLTIFWWHPVAGMPAIAVPPFTIISFELMVWFGAFVGLAGLMFHARLPKFHAAPAYLDRFQLDRIGLVLGCEGREHALRARRLLERHEPDDILYV